MFTKLRNIFKNQEIVDPIFKEGGLAFSNRIRLSENPYSSTNSEHAQLWESGWYAAKVRRENIGLYTTSDSEWGYGTGFAITASITFIASWIYCIATYGFLFGVGLGWLPSIIVAVIAGALWPLIVLGVAVLLLLVFAA